MSNKDFFDLLDDDIPMLDDIAEETNETEDNVDSEEINLDTLIEDNESPTYTVEEDENHDALIAVDENTLDLSISESQLVDIITPIVEEKMQQFASEMSRVIIQDIVKTIKEQE